jgi:hypothetical protein
MAACTQSAIRKMAEAAQLFACDTYTTGQARISGLIAQEGQVDPGRQLV